MDINRNFAKKNIFYYKKITISAYCRSETSKIAVLESIYIFKHKFLSISTGYHLALSLIPNKPYFETTFFLTFA